MKFFDSEQSTKIIFPESLQELNESPVYRDYFDGWTRGKEEERKNHFSVDSGFFVVVVVVSLFVANVPHMIG